MNQDVELPEGLEIRHTEPGDAKYLREWLLDPEIGRWFPMDTVEEVDDAVERWISFHKWKCSWTAVMHGVPAGIVTLYLQPYRKLAHQSEFGILVGKGFRGLSIGSHLMNHMMKMAKEKFRVELLHLQVYAENPAMRLYKRYGFREFGRQTCWIREGGEKNGAYVGRIFMERFL
ncbi:MAG: GNAT family N-acetyltransferase [Chlamydiia bacterium]|nr:GNAT family N-acetyltransferase [Chlamydiia bacterium]